MPVLRSAREGRLTNMGPFSNNQHSRLSTSARSIFSSCLPHRAFGVFKGAKSSSQPSRPQRYTVPVSSPSPSPVFCFSHPPYPYCFCCLDRQGCCLFSSNMWCTVCCVNNNKIPRGGSHVGARSAEGGLQVASWCVGGMQIVCPHVHCGPRSVNRRAFQFPCLI